ncbi:hypothetical protein [Isoalcanivorax beigongshangi]|uniref:Uncharacterized protein n=1 Tax=Isoalcanivorax beigongshangi TaxID=3238810 RepID=A0ABV4AI71_9GAMM
MAAIILGSAVLSWCLLALLQGRTRTAAGRYLWAPALTALVVLPLWALLLPSAPLMQASATPLWTVLLASVWVCLAPALVWSVTQWRQG